MASSIYELAKQVATGLIGESLSEGQDSKIGTDFSNLIRTAFNKGQTVGAILHTGRNTIVPIRAKASNGYEGLAVLDADLKYEGHKG